jgi:hypothetical protein
MERSNKEKIHKIEKPLAKLTKRKTQNKIRGGKGYIPTDTLKARASLGNILKTYISVN